MTFSLDLWQVILLIAMVLGAFLSLLKLLMSQQVAQINAGFAAQDLRLAAIESANREEAGNWQRVERELLAFKAELPMSYVRRDDYIRGQSVVEAKLDGLATKIENAQLRGLINHNAGIAK